MRAWKKMLLAFALTAGVALGGTAEAMTSDEEQQLDVLSSQNRIWEQEMCIEEAIAQDGKFAVTDLDHNGRLELLFTTTIGEEEHVETWGYEVDRDGKNASLLQFLNGSNTTDIAKSPVRKYFACQILKSHYIFENVRWVPSMEGGWARDGRLVSLCLENGVVRQELLGHFYEAYEKRDQAPVQILYSDAKANLIDEEAYKKLAREHYNGCHIFEVRIGWTPVRELAKAMGDQKKVREVFAKSYADFHEEELDEGPVH